MAKNTKLLPGNKIQLYRCRAFGGQRSGTFNHYREWKANCNITFSGDVGRYGDMLLKSPQPFPQADYILLESTYGDSLHKDVGAIEDALLEVIKHTCEDKKREADNPCF